MIRLKPIVALSVLLVGFALLQGGSDETSESSVSGNIALPKDIFKSHFSYLLYEMAHYTPTMISFMVFVVLILLVQTFHYEAVYDMAVIGCGFDLLCLFLALISFANVISNKGFKIKLLVEVITREPAVKGEEWRTIAYNTNQYLFDNNLWNTPYYFYAGDNCYSYFQDLTKGVNPVARAKRSTKRTDNTQSDTSPAQASSNTGKFCTYGSDPILEAYCLKAVEVEQQAQRDYWRKQFPGVDMP